MEDPKRLRTRLRLDLADVRKQIEDLEKLLKEDKSPENVEAHRKLLEYEKKLKDQYEKVTGLSVDQASKLDTKVKIAKTKTSKSSILLGMIGSLLVAWGFYNTLLHSIEGFAPTDVLNWFMGTGESVNSLEFFMLSILYDTSFLFVVLPIGVGSLFVFISALLDKTRPIIMRLFESLAFIGTSGYIAYILFTSPDANTGAEIFTDNMFIYSIVFMVSGLFMIIGAIGFEGIFNKFVGILGAVLFVFSGVQLFLLASGDGSIGLELVEQWPYIIGPVILGFGLYFFNNFTKLFK